ncbi:acyl-CoA thioesterase [Coleofasciculus sp. FACHB-712]|uniref:thioesterase family protein n=1 Tax=Coleofasciculus sp. FACHB-712 TaxID=2692789 RepID=UPI001689CEE4|nr:acyl-CoA thioesterase [Coleofasciculus sp. FACHB-712]
MLEEPQTSPSLPPTGAIESVSLTATTENWFEYPVKAHPHHTDYAGIVWHGSYIAWMEEARVECLRSIGIEFADLVALGCDMPVVDLSVRYHRPLRMGMSAVLKTRMADTEGVRINWDYQLQSMDGQELYLTAKVTLVVVDREKGKIMRQLPPTMKDALARLSAV